MSHAAVNNWNKVSRPTTAIVKNGARLIPVSDIHYFKGEETGSV